MSVIARGVGFGLLTVAAGSGFAAGATAPTLAVKPAVVTLNTDTLVTGRHFKALSRITLVECTRRSWIAPQHPCDTGNSVTVTANAAGRFRTEMVVRRCPGTTLSTGVPVRCYLGVVKPSRIDTIALQPNVQIMITSP